MLRSPRLEGTPTGARRARAILMLASVIVTAMIVLRQEGHRWWCRCGRPVPWSVGFHSPHTSQHFVDPYTPTHVLHGMLFYAVLRLLAGRLRLDVRLILAVAFEALWEVLENSQPVIDRYRQATIALGYSGDTVLNSLGDILACGLGFVLASRLPVRWSPSSSRWRRAWCRSTATTSCSTS